MLDSHNYKLKLFLTILSVLVLAFSFFFIFKPVKNVTKTVTTSSGVTNIYTQYGKETTLTFESEVITINLKDPFIFESCRMDNAILIKPLKKNIYSDMTVLLSDSTIYRLILIEDSNKGTYYGQVKFVTQDL